MELQDFIKETLIQIAAGTKDAQDKIQEIGGYVNPVVINKKNQVQAYFGETALGHHVFLVDFDVAVKAVDKSGGKGGAKLTVASFLSISGSGNSSIENESTSRIKFQISLALPFDKQSMVEKKQQEKQRKKEREKVQMPVNKANPPQGMI